MSLHVPAGACIPVASASPIDVPPIQHVLKHCGAYIHIYIYIYIHTHVIQNNLRTPQLVGFARQLGCKNSGFEPVLSSLVHQSTPLTITLHGTYALIQIFECLRVSSAPSCSNNQGSTVF